MTFVKAIVSKSRFYNLGLSDASFNKVVDLFNSRLFLQSKVKMNVTVEDPNSLKT